MPEACNFCFKNRNFVKRLIVGQSGKAICDECISKATKLADTSPEGRNGAVVIRFPPAFNK